MIEDIFFALVAIGLGFLALAAVVGICALFAGLVWAVVS